MLRILLWLLCLFAPFVGWVAGNWLIPEHRPVWEKSFSERYKLLGFVNEGKTLLVVEYKSMQDATLVGLDGYTGTVQFRELLAESTLGAQAYFHETTRLSRNGNWLLMNAAIPKDSRRHVLCYDWRLKKVVHHFSFQSQSHLEKLFLAGEYLYTFSGKTLVQYRLSMPDQEPRFINREERGSTSELLEQISEDGEWQYYFTNGRWHFEGLVPPNDSRKLLAAHSTKVVNLLRGHQLQTIETVLEDDFPYLTVLSYEVDGDQFTRRGNARHLDYTGSVEHQDGHVLIRGNKLEATLTTTMRKKLGEKWYGYFKKLFPENRKLMLFVLDRTAGSLIGSVPSPPWVEQFFLSGQSGLIAFDKGNQLQIWNLAPFFRWYPMLGFALGLFMALAILSWRIRRRKKTV